MGYPAGLTVKSRAIYGGKSDRSSHREFHGGKFREIPVIPRDLRWDNGATHRAPWDPAGTRGISPASRRTHGECN